MASEAGLPADGGPATDLSPDARRERIGWLRGITNAVAIVAVAFVGVVLAPNALVGMSGSLSFDTRALLATVVGLVVVAVMAFALRRLQAHGWI